MAMNRKQVGKLLEAHEFRELFNQLGWDWPESDSPYPAQIGEELFNLQTVDRECALHSRTWVA